MINVPSYWPDLSGMTLTKTFDGGIVQTYMHFPPDSVCLCQMINGVWDSNWIWRVDSVRGVLEWRDDYPKKGWQNLLFWQPFVSSTMVPGKEIMWGAIVDIGDTIQGQCQIQGNLFGIGEQRGWQRVTFDTLLPSYTCPAGTFQDVLVLTYWQTWGSGPANGAKIWMAKGLGFLRMEWIVAGAFSGYAAQLQSQEWMGAAVA